MKKFVLTSIIASTTIAALSLATLVKAASFDCSKASTNVEMMICTNPELSSQDEQLEVLYKAALTLDSHSYREEQIEWLQLRNQCQTLSCLREKYEERITQLSLLEQSQITGSVKADEYYKNETTNSRVAPSDVPAESSPAEAESDTLSIVIVAQASFLALCISAALVFIYIKRQIKRLGDKRSINKTYLEGSFTQPSFDAEKFIAAHKKKVGKDVSFLQAIVASVDIYCMEIHASGDWEAEIGHLDEQAYQLANASYQQSHMQWKIAKQQWETKKGELFADNTREGIRKMTAHGMSSSWSKFPIEEPVKPNIKNYITYIPSSGECSTSINNQYFIPASSTNLFDPNVQLDPSKISKRILDLYSKILPRITSGQLQVAFNTNTQIEVLKFESMSDEQCIQALSNEIEDELKKNANGYLGKYNKKLKLLGWKYSSEKSSGELQIVLVKSAQKNGKVRISSHDIANPDIVLDVA